MDPEWWLLYSTYDPIKTGLDMYVLEYLTAHATLKCNFIPEIPPLSLHFEG